MLKKRWLSKEALACSERWKSEDASSNGVTFVCILKACENQVVIDDGQELHSELFAQGLEASRSLSET